MRGDSGENDNGDGDEDCLEFRVISTPSATLVHPVSGGQSRDNEDEDDNEEPKLLTVALPCGE